jgi:hypothetical protein
MKLISEAVAATFGVVTWYVAPIISSISPETLKLVALGVAASVFGLLVLIGVKER